MIRIFIADDHAIVRHGLRQLLTDTDNCTVVGEAEDGRQLLNALENVNWDLLILDLSLPKVSGTEVLHRIQRTHPGMKVLVLSMYSEEQYARRMLEAGAHGYIAKSRPPSELLSAIEMVSRGERFVPAALRGPDPTKAPHQSLSSREYQLFMLFLQGRTNAEIAAELNISASTVSNHFTHIKEKLGVRTVADLVSYAHREGLID